MIGDSGEADVTNSLNSKRICRILMSILIFLIAPIMLVACHAQDGGEVGAIKSKDEYIVVGLVGYNYTDRHISDYSVNGAGGGNINLSSPTSGGSGVSCCVKLSKKHTGPIRVTVRWQVDGCKYVESDPKTGAADELRHFYYKETEVDVQRKVDEDANYLETHFYPDGSVQVQLTEYGTEPRLILDQKRPDKSYFPRCKDGKNPAE
jgi:hypothetical protein